jgi:hypothetical protein
LDFADDWRIFFQMSYASLAGRARTSAKKPQAHAICDRCGFRYNFVDLSWQFDYRGPVIANIRILVCRKCKDEAQSQLRAIVLPADPEPIPNARVQDFVTAETDYRSLAETTTNYPTGLPVPSQVLRVTEDCQNRITEPYGAPVGLEQPAIMPYDGTVQKAFAVPISVLSVVSNGTNIIAVSCSRPHGLVTDSQISCAGLTAANGFFSVVVVNPMAFTYAVNGNIKAGSLLTGASRIVTALVGLPYDTPEIPQVGP